MSVTAEALKGLNIETPSDEIKKRPVFNKQKEKVGELDYVDARYCMDLLDEVVGPSNWQDRYRETPGGIVGGVGINVEGEWVWKEDVGTESTLEPVKGAYSDAFKRGCVRWGIARDLYDTRSGAGRGTGSSRPSQTKPRQTESSKPKAKSHRIDPKTAPWQCTTHEGVVVWPAGVSASGRDYDAFYACPKGRDCSERAPRGLKVKPEHLVPGTDDLPF